MRLPKLFPFTRNTKKSLSGLVESLVPESATNAMFIPDISYLRNRGKIWKDHFFQEPATEVGDPVRLVEDVSTERFEGENILVNGGFDTDLSGWTNPSNMFQWVDGRAYHPQGNIYSLGFRQNLVPQERFRILEFDCWVMNGGLAVWGTVNGVPNQQLSIISAANNPDPTRVRVMIPGDCPFIAFARQSAGTGFEGWIDNVVLREERGNHLVAYANVNRGSISNDPFILGREPLKGRRNRLTFTETLDSPDKALGTETTVSPVTEVGPVGFPPSQCLVLGTLGSLVRVNMKNVYQGTYVLSFYAKVRNNINAEDCILHINCVSPAISQQVTLTTEWVRYSVPIVIGPNLFMDYFDIRNDLNSSRVYEVCLTGLQLEEGEAPTPYMRVNEIWDAYEEGEQHCWFIYSSGNNQRFSFEIFCERRTLGIVTTQFCSAADGFQVFIADVSTVDNLALNSGRLQTRISGNVRVHGDSEVHHDYGKRVVYMSRGGYSSLVLHRDNQQTGLEVLRSRKARFNNAFGTASHFNPESFLYAMWIIPADISDEQTNDLLNYGYDIHRREP